MRTIGELEYMNSVLQERLDTEIERGNKLACDLDDAKAEVEKAQAACAFLRGHLVCIRDFDEDSPWEDPGHCAKDALARADDCGNGWISPEMRQQAVEALRELDTSKMKYLRGVITRALAALEGGGK